MTGAVEYVALLLAKYAGELATVAHEIHHDDPGKRERGRRKARRYLKHRLYALKWCIRQLEQLLPAVAGVQAEANAAFELRGSVASCACSATETCLGHLGTRGPD